ncbi:MAG: DUF642 domain-containing protein [Sandarakinorhabdus sp.]|nr:DUF642 domain-containing protein [Sandarakinorhabdus sp.]
MRTLIAIGAALVFSTSAQASTNLVVNGSFENGTAPGGAAFLATNNTTSITGWKVLSTGINYVDNSMWDASDGSRSVELATTAGNGGIWQRISGFAAGYRYRLTFNVSANPFDPALRPKPSRVLVSVTGGVSEIYKYTLNNINTAGNMLYDTVSYDFIASGAMQNVQLRAAVNTQYGPVIDAVNISVVPEVSTWAMLIAGFSLVGLTSRRRNRAAVAA